MLNRELADAKHAKLPSSPGSSHMDQPVDQPGAEYDVNQDQVHSASDPGQPRYNMRTQRPMTAKGQEFAIQQQQLKLHRVYRQLNNTSDEIYSRIYAQARPQEVQILFASWLKNYDDFLNIHDHVVSLNIESHVLFPFTRSYELKHESLIVTREDVKGWLASRTPQPVPRPPSPGRFCTFPQVRFQWFFKLGSFEGTATPCRAPGTRAVAEEPRATEAEETTAGTGHAAPEAGA